MGAGADRPLETGWLADTPVEDTLLRKFLHNQAELNALLAASVEGGRAQRTDDVALNDHRQPVAFLNQALLMRPLSGIDDAVLDDVEAFFGVEGAPPGRASARSTATSPATPPRPRRTLRRRRARSPRCPTAVA